MPDVILVDTDVVVDFLRGDPKAANLIRANSGCIVLSAITVAELYAGVRDDREKQILDDFVSLFRTVPVTHPTAVAGGLYRRDYGRSHGIGLADAIIAATADAENADLLTLNTRHYPMFKKLKPAYRKHV